MSSNATSGRTAPHGQTNQQNQFDDLSDQLTDVKIGIKKDAAMEDLTNALESKWEPNGTYGLSSSDPADVNMKDTPEGEGDTRKS